MTACGPDLRAQLLALVAPTALGQALAAGIVLEDASTELGLRLTLTCEGARIHVEVLPPAPDRPYACRTDRWALSYRGGTGIDPDVAMRVTRAVADRIAANEATVHLPSADEAETGTRIREVTVDRILEPHDGFSTLSPYVGCLIGCRFCYAQSRLMPLRRLLGHADAPWGSWVDARINAAELLGEELRARRPTPIKLCPIVSDPYHAIERKLRLTRACLQTIADVAPDTPVLLLTRSDVILDDLPLLRRLPNLYAGMSVPSADPDVLAHFEPRAAPPKRRAEVLAALADAGIRTIAVAQPQLPGSLDDHVALLAASVQSVSLDVLRGVENAATQFADPRWSHAANDDWQRTRLHELRARLQAVGVAVWPGELPPDLA